MPTYWITPQELVKKAASRMGRDMGDSSGNQAGRIQSVAEDSIRQAHGNIVTILGNRGWSISDLDQWDYREDYLMRMSLYWYFTDLSIDGFDQERIRPYDIRPELSGKDFALIVGGVPKAPNVGETGEDGEDLDDLPGGDSELWGNANLAVGRFSQKNWEVRRNTDF